GQAPSLSLIAKLVGALERLTVIDKAALLLPGQLIDALAHNGNAFAKEIRGQVDLLQDLARLQFDPAQARLPIQPCSLKQLAVDNLQALGKGVWIMRIGGDNLIAVDGNARCP